MYIKKKIEDRISELKEFDPIGPAVQSAIFELELLLKAFTIVPDQYEELKDIITQIICNETDIRGIELSHYKSHFDDASKAILNTFGFDKAEPIKEDTIPVTYGMIKNSCGWSEFCDVTGNNHYAVKEFGMSDREIFEVKMTDAKKLKLI